MPEPARRAYGANARPPLLLELARGRFVDRCERMGNWLAIMFPAPGGTLDCTP